MPTAAPASKLDVTYALTRRLGRTPVAESIARVKEALAAEGFGVLTEIDVQATLEKKLGVRGRPYVILGACNPSLAHRALEQEPSLGVFLPCNVDVLEGEDGATYVQAVRPTLLFSLVQSAGLRPIAEEVEARLGRALAALPVEADA